MGIAEVQKDLARFSWDLARLSWSLPGLGAEARGPFRPPEAYREGTNRLTSRPFPIGKVTDSTPARLRTWRT